MNGSVSSLYENVTPLDRQGWNWVNRLHIVIGNLLVVKILQGSHDVVFHMS